MSVLSTPILFRQGAFDASGSHTFSFRYESGNQAVKNRLIINRNTDNQTVYDKAQSTFRLEHELPAGTLQNGEYYNAKIQVFDNQGNESALSQAIAFVCLDTPVFGFFNLSEGQIVQGASYRFALRYEQQQGEQLDSYRLMLFDGARRQRWNSGLCTDNLLAQTVQGLGDNENYYIQAQGQTVNGMELDTGLVAFSVDYVRPAAFAVVELDNQYDKGCVRISSNIISILGSCDSQDPSYRDGTWIDLTDGDTAWFDEGFRIDGDFTLAAIGKSYGAYQTILTLRESDGGEDRVELSYMLGRFQGYLFETAYIKLDYYHDEELAYTLYSNLFYPDLNDEQDGFVLYVRRVNGLYHLWVEAPEIDRMEARFRFGHSQLARWRGYNGEVYPEGYILDGGLSVSTELSTEESGA